MNKTYYIKRQEFHPDPLPGAAVSRHEVPFDVLVAVVPARVVGGREDELLVGLVLQDNDLITGGAAFIRCF